MASFIIFSLIVLVFIAIFQIAKASETASILKGLKEGEQTVRTNNLMAWLMGFVFLAGMYTLYQCHKALMPLMLPVPASNHGVKYEEMLYVTNVLTVIVFVITQFMLFFFIIRYRDNGKRKASYLPHNNVLEIIWTTIPALTLLTLIIIGLKHWNTMTGAPPKDKMVVEVVGKQFNFIIRYPGADGKFGKVDFRKINEENNILGLDWDDPNSKDDIVVQNGELHLVKEKPVQLVIRSRDVIHDVGLPHFRMKMDAVPGLTTTMWFTPLYTSKEMQEITKNPEFVYEINCAEMCGKGHFSMRGTVVVGTQSEFNIWLKQQKPYYASIQPQTEVEAPKPSDDTKKEETKPEQKEEKPVAHN